MTGLSIKRTELLSTVSLILTASVVVGTPLETRVLTILDRHCSECHGEDNHPELHGGINLSELLRNEEYITPGQPMDSQLYLQMAPRTNIGRAPRMPKNRLDATPKDADYRPPLSKSELQTIAQWIHTKDLPNAPRRHVDIKAVLRSIADDLEDRPPSETPFIRYLTLANLYNIRDADFHNRENDGQMETYRAAVSKLLNSLSGAPKPVIPEAVDDDRTIFRINLRDYQLTAEEWDHWVARYPYALEGVDPRLERRIQRLSSSQRIHVRADWFAASSPREVQETIREETARRAGKEDPAMPGYKSPLDPVAILIRRFQDDVFADQFPTEFGKRTVDLRRRLERVDSPKVMILLRQWGSSAPFARNEFDQLFHFVAPILGYTVSAPLRIAKAKKTEKQPVTAPKTEPITTPFPVASSPRIPEPSNSSPPITRVKLPEGGTLTLSANQARFRISENLQVYLRSDSDCHVIVNHYSSDGYTTQLLPNRLQTNNFIRAGGHLAIPDAANSTQRYVWETTEPPGAEFIEVIASDRPFTGSKHRSFSGGDVFRDITGQDRGMRGRPKQRVVSDTKTARPGRKVTARIGILIEK